MIEAWLGQVVLDAAAEYAEKKNAKERRMQAGQSRRCFLKVLGHAKDREFPDIFLTLCRFSEYEGVLPEILLQAASPLSLEHECSGDYFGPKTRDMAKRPADTVVLMRRSVERWSEWLDALVHWQTHEMFHLSPVAFDPDAEKRELTALGVNQRSYAQLNDFSKAWWKWHHEEAAEWFKDSPKWQTLGKAMASTATRHWNYPELDAVVISLWPLLRRHNWTYRDMLNLVRRAVACPDAYPCQNEQEFTTYCVNVLGLRKTGNGRTAKNGRPIGYDVAMRICKMRQPLSS